MKRLILQYLSTMLPFRWVVVLAFLFAYKLVIWICLPSGWGWIAFPAVILTDLLGGIGRPSPFFEWLNRRLTRKK